MELYFKAAVFPSPDLLLKESSLSFYPFQMACSTCLCDGVHYHSVFALRHEMTSIETCKFHLMDSKLLSSRYTH